MRLFLLVCLPMMVYAMDKTAEPTLNSAEEEVSVAYWNMYISIAIVDDIRYSNVVERLISAEEKEKKYAHLLTANFYNVLYLNKIMPIVGGAQAFYTRTKERFERQKSPNAFSRLCEANTLELVAAELREKIRKKANR